jgi:hypothetical protein
MENATYDTLIISNDEYTRFKNSGEEKYLEFIPSHQVVTFKKYETVKETFTDIKPMFLLRFGKTGLTFGEDLADFKQMLLDNEHIPLLVYDDMDPNTDKTFVLSILNTVKRPLIPFNPQMISIVKSRFSKTTKGLIYALSGLFFTLALRTLFI